MKAQLGPGLLLVLRSFAFGSLGLIRFGFGVLRCPLVLGCFGWFQFACACLTGQSVGQDRLWEAQPPVRLVRSPRGPIELLVAAGRSASRSAGRAAWPWPWTILVTNRQAITQATCAVVGTPLTW